jgi:hypothetical protein
MLLNPEVGIVMRVHGQRQFLDSVHSVLNQTYERWILVLSLDEISDHNRQIATGLANEDSRIILHEYSPMFSKEKYGYRPSDHLNQAFGILTNSVFFMVLDSDDFMFPDKIEVQVKIMSRQSSKNLVVLGSQSALVNTKREIVFRKLSYPALDSSIRRLSNFRQPFIHSSTIFRSDVFRSIGGYDVFFKFGEERDLYSRLLRHGKGRNLIRSCIIYTTNKSESELDYPRSNEPFWKCILNSLNLISNFTYLIPRINYLGREEAWFTAIVDKILKEQIGSYFLRVRLYSKCLHNFEIRRVNTANSTLARLARLWAVYERVWHSFRWRFSFFPLLLFHLKNSRDVKKFFSSSHMGIE